MPEGDTVHHAAKRVGDALVGKRIISIETPQARHAANRWPERLAGRAVHRVHARGKHLLVRFEGELTLHSHLRMRGSWGVYARGERWRRSPRRAWLVIRTAAQEVVQFDGPVLELMSEGRSGVDRLLAGLGPDVLGDGFDARAFVRRLREDDPTLRIGEALLDQRIVAGIGNIWKSESCFLAAVDPWRPLSEVSDEEALRIVAEARREMRVSADVGGYLRQPRVYGRAGLSCPRCGGPIKARRQGDDNRITYWCLGCQS